MLVQKKKNSRPGDILTERRTNNKDTYPTVETNKAKHHYYRTVLHSRVVSL
jgi:hypothetical protein